MTKNIEEETKEIGELVRKIIKGEVDKITFSDGATLTVDRKGDWIELVDQYYNVVIELIPPIPGHWFVD